MVQTDTGFSLCSRVMALTDPPATAGEIVRAAGSNLAFALAVLPRDRRDDMRVFYAFCRVVDDIVDSETAASEEKSAALDRWRALVRNDAAIQPSARPGLEQEMLALCEKRQLPVQTLIEIMQPGIDTHDPDYHAAQVMNFILGSSGFGSRLTTEIREKRGLTYGIYSTFYNLDHLFGFTVSTSTKNENVPEMLSLIQKEFQTMLSDNVSKKELEDAKSYLIGSLPLSLTSTDKIAGLLLSLQLNGRLANYLELRENAIESVSVKDVRRVAERILTPENFTTVLVGKPEGLDNATPIKKIPNAE